MDANTSDRFARVRAEILNSREIPTVPAVLGRILSVIARDHSSPQELVEVMAQDQALTGRVLRLANSAFFGLSRNVTTVMRAVLLLGFKTVQNLALGVKVWEVFLKRGGVPLAEIFEHSALVAPAARALAQRTRIGDPDTAFTAGLLHDIGRVVLNVRFPKEYFAVTCGAAEELTEREREAFGADHAQAGAWLTEAWLLPISIVGAARQHHDSLTPSQELSEPFLVNLANRLVHWTDFQSEGGQVILDPQAERLLDELAGIGFSRQLWSGIASELRGQTGELKRLFGGDV